MIENLGALNPMKIMGSFVEGSTPPCVKLTKRTGPWNRSGAMKTESHYVAVKDREGFHPPGTTDQEIEWASQFGPQQRVYT